MAATNKPRSKTSVGRDDLDRMIGLLDTIKAQQTDLIIGVTELRGEIARVDTVNNRLIKDVEDHQKKLMGLERAYWKIALAFTLIGAIGTVEAKLLGEIFFR